MWAGDGTGEGDEGHGQGSQGADCAIRPAVEEEKEEEEAGPSGRMPGRVE